MPKKFSGKDIIEMGIEIEKNGKAFYEALAKKVDDRAVKIFFDDLADEEEKHVTVFNGILSKVTGGIQEGVFTEEYTSYMNALASDHVFTRKNQGEAEARKINDEKEAVNVGIGFEKESILFYEGMKTAVPEKDHGVLNTLIAQEKNHLRRLYEMKAKLG